MENKQTPSDPVQNQVYAQQKKQLKRMWITVLLFAVLALGSVLLIAMTHPSEPAPAETGETVQVVSPLQEVETREELEQRLGFAVEDLTGLPFTPESVARMTIQDELAQVIYTAGEEKAVFRKGAGAADISGDYQVYETVTPLALEGLTGELRGGPDGYVAAIWSTDAWSWSLSLTTPIPEADMLNLIQGI